MTNKFFGGTPAFIPARDVKFIKNMDKEKHRIRLLEKSAP